MHESETKRIANYIKDKGISIKSISNRTGISVGVLYPALGSGKRELRAGEFLSVCACLEKDPYEFSNIEK